MRGILDLGALSSQGSHIELEASHTSEQAGADTSALCPDQEPTSTEWRTAMNHESASPFDSIESAHDFIVLLGETVADSKREIQADVDRESNRKAPRRLEALRLALYNLDKLELHINKSRRILNDLRSLRRLLFEERGIGRASIPAEPVKPAMPTPVEIFRLNPTPPGSSVEAPGMAVAS
jgi:hypothetical protein